MFEMVEVKEQQGASQAVALVQGIELAQAVAQQQAIGQVGQCVVVREVFDAGLNALLFGDVAGGQQHAVEAIQR